MLKLFGGINNFIENATRAGRLDKVQRRELMAEQIHALVEMTPAMALGCFVIISMLLFSAMDNVVFNHLVVWSLVLGTVQLLGLYQWWQTRNLPKKLSVSIKALRTASVHAAILGTVWGVLPFLVFPTDDTNLKLISVMALTGVFCGSAFALAVIPQ